VNTYFSTQLKVIAEKITKICTLDKKVWNDLDNQEQKCSDVVREVEKVRDEMVGNKFLKYQRCYILNYLTLKKQLGQH